jgi:hypothetical protein
MFDIRSSESNRRRSLATSGLWNLAGASKILAMVRSRLDPAKMAGIRPDLAKMTGIRSDLTGSVGVRPNLLAGIW